MVSAIVKNDIVDETKRISFFGDADEQTVLSEKRSEDVAKDKTAKLYLVSEARKGDTPAVDLTFALEAFKEGDIREKDLRRRIAIKRNEREKQELMSIIEKVDNGKVRLTPENLDVLRAAYSSVFQRKLEEIEETAVEREYAETFANKVAMTVDTNNPDITRNNEEKTLDGIDVLEDLVTKQEIARDYFGKAKAAYEQQSTFGAVVDFAKFLVPLYDIYKTLQTAGITEVEGSIWTKGTTLESVYEKLWLLPPEEFKKQVDTIYKRLAADNPQYAIMWFNGLMEYSKREKYLDNLFSVSDVLSVGADVAAIGAKLGMKSAARFAKMKSSKLKETLKSAAKANADSIKQTADETLARAGMEKEAAITKVVDDVATIRNEFADKLNVFERDSVYKALDEILEPTGIINPEKYLRGVDSIKLHHKMAENIKRSISTKANEILDAISPGGLVRVARIPEDSERLSYLAEEAMKRFYLLNNKAENGILEKTIIHSDETVDNVNKIELTLGNWHTGGGFDTEHQARTWAGYNYKLKKGSYDIVSDNGKFYIKTTVDIDETAGNINIRPDLLETESKVKETNPVKAVVNRLLSAEATLGSETVEARKTFVYSAQKVHELLQDFIGKYLTLPRKQKKNFHRFLNAHLYAVDIKTGEQGVVFDNVGEFIDAWTRMFGKQPTKKVIESYFQWRLMMDFDYVVRNIAVRRDLVRQGVKRFRINKFKLEFNGKVVDDLPWDNNHEAFIAVIDEAGKTKFIRKNNITDAQRKMLKKAIEDQNFMVIQIANPAELPFYNRFKRLPIHFTVVPKKYVQDGPLPFKLLNYNPGAGHLVYKDNYYTKIPLVKFNKKQDIYEYLGDFTIATHTTKEEAQEFAKKVEELLAIMKSTEDDAAIHAFIRENGLPFDVEEFRNILTQIGSRKAVNKVVALADGDDLYHVLKNNILRDKNVVNLYDTPYNLTNSAGVSFAGKRDMIIPKVSRVGNETRPAFRMEVPRLLDPVSTLAKANFEDANLLLLKDYKTKAINDFMTQFGDLIKNYDPKLNNMYEAFANPQWNEKATDYGRLVSAKRAYLTVKNLWDIPSPTESWARFAKENLLGKIDSMFGKQAAEVFNDRAIPFIKDPITRLRALTFHAKIGLWATGQLIQQAAGFVGVMALTNPRVAIPAFIDGNLLYYRHYAQVAKSLLTSRRKRIFKSAKLADDVDFDEMMETFEKSGFARVGNEYADLDTTYHPQKINSRTGIALEVMKTPFKMGEKFSRAIAWAAAYREWKLMNGGRKVDQDGIREILNMADDFVGRMSAASRTKIQERGILAIPTQFWTYMMHMTELAWERSIKNPAKFAQIVLVFSLMFGVDDAVTLFTTVPLADSLRTWLSEYDAENGTNYAELMDNPVVDFLMEGVIGVIGDNIASRPFNFSEKLGLNGLPLWKPVINMITYEDIDRDTAKEIVDVLIGAPGQTVKQILQSTGPITRNLIHAARGDFEAIGMSPEDWLKVTEPFVSANNHVKSALWRAYGRYLTKHGMADIGEPSYMDELLVSMGFVPKEINNVYFKYDQLNRNRKMKKYWSDKLRSAVRFYAEAVNNNDERMADFYRKQMAVILEVAELTPMEKSEMILNIIREHKDIIRDVDEKYNRLQIKRLLRSQTNEE